MALEKEGYKPAINGTTIVQAPLDPSGNLIYDDDEGDWVAAGTKTFNITRTNAANDRVDNHAVIAALFGFTNTVYENADKFRVTWESY